MGWRFLRIRKNYSKRRASHYLEVVVTDIVYLEDTIAGSYRLLFYKICEIPSFL
jgi:hypothetical protein